MRRQKSIGFKTKFVLIFILVTLAPLIFYAVYSVSKTQAVLKDQFQYQTQRLLQTNLSDVLQAQEDVMVEMSHNPIIKSLDYQKAEPYFKNFIKNHPEYSHILICDPEGTEIAHSEGIEHHGKNIANKEYFKTAWETGKPVISDATFSTSTGRKIIGLGVPIFDNDGKKTGVLVGFIHLKYVSDRISAQAVTESGYTIMLNKKGEYIGHPDQTKLLEENALENKKSDADYQSLVKKMISGESGIKEVVLDGEKVIVNYKPTGINGWSIAMVSPVDEVYALTERLKTDTAVAVVVIAVLVILLALFLANKLVQPINKLVRAADTASSGDLTTNIAVHTNDEVGLLASSFNQMVENLKIMINEVRSNAKKIALHSQDLASASEEVSATMENVADTSRDVVSLSDRGVHNAAHTAAESKQVQSLAEEGNRAVQETVAKITAIASDTEKVADAVYKLGKQSEQIGTIIVAITNIAEQTNLLALNAAIEAARAGEHGRGFAVVAEEVRNLAEQSADAAREITDIVNEIRVDVDNAIEAMKTGAKEVNEGVKVADRAGAALNQIIEAVNKNTAMINEIAESARQTNLGTKQLSAANEQITAAVQQVTGSAQELAAISVQLESILNKFKVEENSDNKSETRQ